MTQTILNGLVLAAAGGEPTFLPFGSWRTFLITVGGILTAVLGLIFLWRSRKSGAVKENGSGALAALIGIFFLVGGAGLFAVAGGAGDFFLGS